MHSAKYYRLFVPPAALGSPVTVLTVYFMCRRNPAQPREMHQNQRSKFAAEGRLLSFWKKGEEYFLCCVVQDDALWVTLLCWVSF